MGKRLRQALVERFNRVFGAIGVPRLVNLYGPTEATVDVSYFDCPSAGPVDAVPIGRPIDNTMLLVPDERGNRCPVGVPARLNIGGGALPVVIGVVTILTAAAFVADERFPGGRRYGRATSPVGERTATWSFRAASMMKSRSAGNRVCLARSSRDVVVPGWRSAVGVAEPLETHCTY